MNVLEKKLKYLKRTGRKALIAYLTAGFPSGRQTVRLAGLLEKNGADVIEIGVPFSDPIADGKTIQYSSQKALASGMTLRKAFGIAADIRKRSDIPLVMMGYLNPFLKIGFLKTAETAMKCGINGLIIPDAIPEENNTLRKICATSGISLIQLASPSTPLQRLARIDRASRGFVYMVSIAGVTGARRVLPQGVQSYLAAAKKCIIKNPRILGFGISTPEQINELKGSVDGFIVGSAFVDLIRKYGSGPEGCEKLTRLTRSLRKALDS